MKEMTKKRKKQEQSKKTHESTGKTIYCLPSLSTLGLEKPDMFSTNMKQFYIYPFSALETKEEKKEQKMIMINDEYFQEVKEKKEIEEDIQEKSTEFTTMKPITTRGFNTTIYHKQHSPRSHLGGGFQNSGNVI